VTIRRAKLEEWTKIKELNGKLFEFDSQFDKFLNLNWPNEAEQYYKYNITSKDSVTYVAEAKGKIVGYLIGAKCTPVSYLSKEYKIAEIENMYVEEEFRNEGLGKKLISKFEEWAAKKGFNLVEVTASYDNIAARKFYNSNSYKEQITTLYKEVQ
jgi:GNAT superfamily N-acetyltransferase